MARSFFSFLWAIFFFLPLSLHADWHPTYGGYQSYDSYGGYHYDSYGSYGSYGNSESQVISIDMDPHHLLDSSFRVAAREDRASDMLKFVQQGADVNSTSDEGMTALMYASRNCSTRIVHELLALKKVDVNVTDQEGDTALIYATTESCLPVVKLLLSRPELNLRIRDRSGRDVMDFAQDCAEIDVDGPATQILRLLESRENRMRVRPLSRLIRSTPGRRHRSRTQVLEKVDPVH